MGRRGLAPATREAYGRVARSYLVFLERRGIAVLDGADGASVLAFLESYWIGGPGHRCFGWCRTFVRS
ncbi:putative integrase/recombinase domain protein [Mycobacterium kansasii 824]|nr:putative integrase/recombinase domain protein [Mycobacterium kansasii 824]